MSHNLLKVAGQSPSRLSQNVLNSTNLGGFTSSVTNAFFGVDGSGNPKNVSLPAGEGITVVYSAVMIGTGWGGTSTYSVNTDLQWRKASATEYVNSSYANISGGTWADTISVNAGTYVFIATHPASSSTDSNTLGVRLYNNTAGSYIGPTFQKGGGKGADVCFNVATLSSTSDIRWRVVSISGSWSLPNAATHRGLRILIFKV